MATISRRVLSASTRGRAIAVTATVGVTTIHTADTGTAVFDEVYLYCQNNYSKSFELILEIGQSATTTVVIASIPPRGVPELVLPGFTLQGLSGGGDSILAYVGPTITGDSASQISSESLCLVFGHVNRIDQS